MSLDLDFDKAFAENRVGAYERLLLDVIAGRLNLFVRSDEQEEAWRWVEPILDAWRDDATRAARRTAPAPGARRPRARWSRATATPGRGTVMAFAPRAATRIARAAARISPERTRSTTEPFPTAPPKRVPFRARHFSMIRGFHLADFFTLGNAACGVGAVFMAMRYLASHARRATS